VANDVCTYGYGVLGIFLEWRLDFGRIVSDQNNKKFCASRFSKKRGREFSPRFEVWAPAHVTRFDVSVGNKIVDVILSFD
jgi:hypothetical protein